MISSGFQIPVHPIDLESIWLCMQIEIQKRINNPSFSQMEDYLKPYMSQDNYNFICEMSRIKDDYSKWMAEHKLPIDSPFVFTDVEIVTRWRELTMLRFKALGEELGRLSVPDEKKVPFQEQMWASN
jgi:hypothetical protein